VTGPRITGRWRVHIWLGEQCDWSISGEVHAMTRAAAISTARAEVAMAWPHLADTAQFGQVSAVSI